MLKKDKVKFIIEKLDELYPSVEPPLNHSSHFTLLIAVLLSANSTDKSVIQLVHCTDCKRRGIQLDNH